MAMMAMRTVASSTPGPCQAGWATIFIAAMETIHNDHNDELRLDQVPEPEADWPTISAFALTFNGYEVWGSFQKCAQIANIANMACHSTLTELRTCLFFEQRRWRHFGDEPDEEAMEYIRSVVQKIRAKLAAGQRQ